MMTWARLRGDRPRRSARPCSVTMICVSCSVWSTCEHMGDRKSTRLNSSHLVISYAVFCLKKKQRSTSDALARMLLVSAGYKAEDAELVNTGRFGEDDTDIDLRQVPISSITDLLQCKV